MVTDLLMSACLNTSRIEHLIVFLCQVLAILGLVSMILAVVIGVSLLAYRLITDVVLSARHERKRRGWS